MNVQNCGMQTTKRNIKFTHNVTIDSHSVFKKITYEHVKKMIQNFLFDMNNIPICQYVPSHVITLSRIIVFIAYLQDNNHYNTIVMIDKIVGE